MNITFEQAFDSYQKFLKIKRKQSSYRSITNRITTHILPFVGTKLINKFSTFDYLEWQSYIDEKDLSLNYKRTLHTCFVTFLNYCVNFYKLPENVASKCGNFKNENLNENDGKIWTIEEFRKFIQVVDDQIYKVLFDFMFFTGCRLGETLGIKFENLHDNQINIKNNATRFFDKNGNRIITTTKTKKSTRIICVDNVLKNEILDLQKYYSTKFKDFNDKFFIFGGKKTLAPTTITRKKDNWCKTANVKRIKIHEFRHSHACLLFQNNVPIDDISSRLGHSKISMTTDIYLRFIPKDEKRVLKTLNDLRLVH